jgi:hypothetical protein
LVQVLVEELIQPLAVTTLLLTFLKHLVEAAVVGTTTKQVFKAVQVVERLVTL